jgi:AraC family ethanolamine operon transcriptional activator
MQALKFDHMSPHRRPNLTFDEYLDAIRVARVVYLRTGPTIGHWDHAWCQLCEATLQFGSDGSARIVHGTMPAGTYIFIFQSTQYANAVILDGQLIHWSELMVLPPDQHFTFVSNIPLSWIAVSLPIASAERVLSSSRNWSGNAQGNNRLIARTPELSVNKLVKLAKDARTMSKNGRQDMGEIETALLSQLSVIFEMAVLQSRPAPSTLSAERIIRDALNYVERKETGNIHVDDLVNVAHVDYRKLLRAFQRYLRVTPKRYLRLRQLNLVRRALYKQKRPLRKHVIDIMADFGVTEFGRFATQYRLLFGELPSDTLHKASTYIKHRRKHR